MPNASGGIIISAAGQIANGIITNTHINAAAAIARSKFAALKSEIARCVLRDSNASQSIPNATWTVVTFNTEIIDEDNMHEGVTNPGRITPNKAGYWLFQAIVRFTAAAVGTVAAALQLNTATYYGYNGRNNASGSPGYMHIQAVIPIAAADYVQVIVYQDSGAALTITSENPAYPRFSAVFLGEV